MCDALDEDENNKDLLTVEINLNNRLITKLRNEYERKYNNTNMSKKRHGRKFIVLKIGASKIIIKKKINEWRCEAPWSYTFNFVYIAKAR